MKSEIVLFRDRGVWMAWHKGPLADRTRQEFGTDTLPTSWMDRADPVKVFTSIKERNPETIVSVRQ